MFRKEVRHLHANRSAPLTGIDTDLVWGDLSNLTSSLPPQYSNLTKVRRPVSHCTADLSRYFSGTSAAQHVDYLKTDAPTTSGGILWHWQLFDSTHFSKPPEITSRGIHHFIFQQFQRNTDDAASQSTGHTRQWPPAL